MAIRGMVTCLWLCRGSGGGRRSNGSFWMACPLHWCRIACAGICQGATCTPWGTTMKASLALATTPTTAAPHWWASTPGSVGQSRMWLPGSTSLLWWPVCVCVCVSGIPLAHHFYASMRMSGILVILLCFSAMSHSAAERTGSEMDCCVCFVVQAAICTAWEAMRMASWAPMAPPARLCPQ